MRKRIWKLIKEWVPSIAIALVISLVVNTYVAQAVKVPTNSMVPTINVGDRLVIEKMNLSNLQHGDIIAFWPPIPGNEDRYIKRLIGLPGDTIEVKGGILYRNGEKVDEPYVNEPMRYMFGPIVVPEDQYVFLGDNRNISNDSHRWATPFVAKDKLIGKAIFRFFPFEQIGTMD